jgi:ABC-type uncharacterized transport system involved in gliding motility auxiliary subunit
MNKTFTTGRLVVIAAILGAVIFGSINIIAANALRGARLDLTQQHLYSLSEGTKAMVGKLAEPIRFRFFMSSGLTREAPQLAAFASRVRAMLDSYVAASHGKIILEVIDPKPYSEDEDRAVAFGISPIQSSTGDRLFFGLAATNSTTGKATIGSFSPDREAFLEYDLTRLVAELDRKGKAVVALIDGMNLQGNPQMGLREQQVLTQMKQFFDVKPVQGDVDQLPADTRVLMVVQPQNLSDKTKFAIDQWVMGGGATLIFVDPNAENQIGPRGAPPPDTSSDLPKLFAAWGVKYDPKMAVADPGFALQTERVINGRPAQMSNLPWIAVHDEGLHKDDAILAQLSAMVFTTTGAFEASKPGVTLRPLVTGSKKAGLLPADQMKDRQADLRMLLTRIQPGANPPVIAARVTGTLESAFPTPPEGVTPKGEVLTTNVKPANLIVVGDADAVMDRNWVQRRNMLGSEVAQAFANNGDFVINAIEQMAGGAMLADLRGRGVSWRPFEKIQQIEQDANQRYRAKEQALQEKLKDAEQKLQELGRGGQKGTEVLTPQQVQTIEKFRTEVLATREELRSTQFALRRDVDRLKNTIIAINVAGVPLFVGIFALALAFRRRKRDLPRKDA